MVRDLRRGFALGLGFAAARTLWHWGMRLVALTGVAFWAWCAGG